MDEKKKFSYSTLFLVLGIIIIAIMGYFLYKIYNDKLVHEDNIVKLNAEISDLKSEISSINNKKDDTINNENNSSADIVKTDFYGVYISSDKTHKLIFLPNGEMCSINNDASDYKVMPGTYDIKNNTLYYSTSKMIEWFGGRHYAFLFNIVDRNTLTYNQTNYTRETEEKLNGRYNSMDGWIEFDNNGNFEISSSDGEYSKGDYIINNDILKLNNESEEKSNETFEITYLILDKDTIVAQWEVEGKLYYKAYIK